MNKHFQGKSRLFLDPNLVLGTWSGVLLMKKTYRITGTDASRILGCASASPRRLGVKESHTVRPRA